MNNKFYVGNKASSFEAYNEIGPITGVSLLVDDETEYIAGTNSGFVLEVNCPFGTQTMANDILAKVNGKTYKGYRAEGAELDPTAELGDGITIRGLYSMLAFRAASFGPGYMSEISAPGESDLDHEYPYITGTERKILQSQATVNDWLAEQNLELKAAIDNATQQITGAKGGNIVFRYNKQGQPYEMLIMDTDDINTAKNVWRWNSGGFGHSSNGYKGPYTLAATQDGAINASLITVGELIANIIKSGRIESKNGQVYFDLDGNEIACSKMISTIYHTTVQDDDQTILDFGYTTGTSSWYSSAILSLTTKSMEKDVDKLQFSLNKQAPNEALGIVYPATALIVGPLGGEMNIYCQNGTGRNGPQIHFYAGKKDGSGTLDLRGATYKLSLGTQMEWNGAATISGNLKVNGQFTSPFEKHRLVKTDDYGNRLLTCYETAAPMFGDVGFGVTDENGECYVSINPIFSETISKMEYHVFLQKESAGDIWVEDKMPSYFLVKGTPNVRFSWEMKVNQIGCSLSYLEDYDAMNFDEYEILKTIKYSDNLLEDEITEMIQEREDELYEAA